MPSISEIKEQMAARQAARKAVFKAQMVAFKAQIVAFEAKMEAQMLSPSEIKKQIAALYAQLRVMDTMSDSDSDSDSD